MKNILLAASALVFLGTSVYAASHANAILDRKASMQEVRGISKALNDMSRGRADFDLSVITSNGEKLSEIAERYITLFPEGTETGEKTKAAPTIWSDRVGFEAEAAKLGEAGVLLAAATDEASFQIGLDGMNGTCRSCHSKYQLR